MKSHIRIDQRVVFLEKWITKSTTAVCLLVALAIPICMAAQNAPWQKLYAQQAVSPSGGIQANCLDRPGVTLIRPNLPPAIMNRICKLALGGMQTPHPSGDLAKSSQSGGFTIFDPPGSTATVPSAIMANGVVIGSYSDAAGLTHGFLRSKNGSFTTIDVPGAQVTTPTAINPGGVITGWYCPTVDCEIGGTTTIGGFLQSPDGTFTTFTPPAGGFIYGSIYTASGLPPSINPAGDIAGTYVDPSFVEHGFLRTKNGAFTTFDFPGASFTEVLAINPAGAIVGDFCNLSTCYRGFLRTPNGTFLQIGPPGAAVETIPFDINPSGAVTGTYYDGVNPLVHGYLLAPDATFTLFDPVGSAYTSPLAINPAGTITGGYIESGAHGFLRAPDGTITTFDPPGSMATAGTAINPGGVVTGIFVDANGVVHGFVYGP